jgi:hypothetical protein
MFVFDVGSWEIQCQRCGKYHASPALRKLGTRVVCRGNLLVGFPARILHIVVEADVIVLEGFKCNDGLSIGVPIGAVVSHQDLSWNCHVHSGVVFLGMVIIVEMELSFSSACNLLWVSVDRQPFNECCSGWFMMLVVIREDLSKSAFTITRFFVVK